MLIQQDLGHRSLAQDVTDGYSAIGEWAKGGRTWGTTEFGHL